MTCNNCKNCDINIKYSKIINENATIPVNRNIYVDIKYGNNTTGLIEQMDKPFQTLEKALSMVNDDEGFNIILRPGIYELLNNVVLPNNINIIIILFMY